MALMGDMNWWGPNFLKRLSTSFSHGERRPAVQTVLAVRDARELVGSDAS